MGNIVSTTEDLRTFLSTLLGGRGRRVYGHEGEGPGSNTYAFGTGRVGTHSRRRKRTRPMTARQRCTCLLMSTCLLGLLLTPAAQAAQEAFLRLDGIPGESRDARFKDTIDVLAFSWGVSAAGTRPAFQNFSFSKRVDQASPLLLQRVAAGQVIPRATLSVRDAGKPQDFLVYCLTDVRVTELATSGSAGDDRPAEQVALSYGTIFETYRKQNPDGTLSAPFTGGFDILRNVLLGTSAC